MAMTVNPDVGLSAPDTLHEIAALIDGVTGNKPLPAHIRRDIVERTDGIPLFVEEMTKAVLEAESEGDAQQTAVIAGDAIYNGTHPYLVESNHEGLLAWLAAPLPQFRPLLWRCPQACTPR